MKKRQNIFMIFILMLMIPCVFVLTACGTTDPSKMIFNKSPYVEYDDSWTTSDWTSWNFEIKKSGSFSFDLTDHKYSVKNRTYTTINFDKVEGSWEYIGTFKQDYKVYQTKAKIISTTKSQSFAIYKLNGLKGGFSSSVADDGTITKNTDDYQGYCVYRYGDKHTWTVGKNEGISIFFTNEIIDENLLNKTIDNDSLSTGWRYGSIGNYNYPHTVKVS